VDVATVAVVERNLSGLLLDLTGPWGQLRLRIGVVGDYNAMNVLQAVAACWALGVKPGDLALGSSSIEAPPGRLQRVGSTQSDIEVFVDYAHSDDSLANVLRAVGSVMQGRGQVGHAFKAAAGAQRSLDHPTQLWVVFGCGGDKDKTKRPRMGLASSTFADRVVVTTDNPRTERPGSIIDDILAGVPAEHRAKVVVQADRGRAIAYAIENASPGDVVVLAGKGHETEQIVSDGKGGTLRLRFDDCEVAVAAMELRAQSQREEG